MLPLEVVQNPVDTGSQRLLCAIWERELGSGISPGILPTFHSLSTHSRNALCLHSPISECFTSALIFTCYLEFRVIKTEQRAKLQITLNGCLLFVLFLKYQLHEDEGNTLIPSWCSFRLLLPWLHKLQFTPITHVPLVV